MSNLAINPSIQTVRPVQENRNNTATEKTKSNSRAVNREDQQNFLALKKASGSHISRDEMAMFQLSVKDVKEVRDSQPKLKGGFPGLIAIGTMIGEFLSNPKVERVAREVATNLYMSIFGREEKDVPLPPVISENDSEKIKDVKVSKVLDQVNEELKILKAKMESMNKNEKAKVDKLSNLFKEIADLKGSLENKKMSGFAKGAVDSMLTENEANIGDLRAVEATNEIKQSEAVSVFNQTLSGSFSNIKQQIVGQYINIQGGMHNTEYGQQHISRDGYQGGDHTHNN